MKFAFSPVDFCLFKAPTSPTFFLFFLIILSSHQQEPQEQNPFYLPEYSSKSLKNLFLKAKHTLVWLVTSVRDHYGS